MKETNQEHDIHPSQERLHQKIPTTMTLFENVR